MASDSEDWLCLQVAKLPEPDAKPVSSEDIIANIDAEADILGKTVDNLRETMTYLYTVRNRHIPIHRLPSEILAEIFDILAQTFPENLDLLTINDVCTHWRSIALENAKLWARIPLDDNDAASLFLSRSKSVPITLIVGGNHPLPDGCIRPLLSHQHRVRSIHAATFQASDVRWLARKLTRMSELQVLHLSTPGDEAITMSEAFGGYSPSLRSLLLEHVSIPWLSSLYTNLTELRLLHQPCDPSLHIYSPSTFLRMLERCPRLETLIVHGGGAQSYDLTGARMVNLPCLKELELICLYRGILAVILRLLSLPERTRITLEEFRHAMPQGVVDVLPSDRSALPGFATHRSLEFYVERNSYVTIRADADASSFCVAPLFELRLPDTVPGLTALHSFSLAKIEVLVLAGVRRVSQEAWCTFFAELEQLHTLRLINIEYRLLLGCIIALYEAREQDSAPENAEQGGNMRCPLLRNLDIIHAHFKLDLKTAMSHAVRARSWKVGGSMRNMELLEVRGYEDVEVAELRSHGVTIFFNDEEELPSHGVTIFFNDEEELAVQGYYFALFQLHASSAMR